MFSRVQFSSKCGEWSTPQDVFDELDREFGFTLDVCATVENHKCGQWIDEKMNGLFVLWSGVCWCNPPYGRSIGEWVARAYEFSLRGVTTVLLLPARTDTKWFHEYIALCADDVRFIKGRLHFGGAVNSAPFPSMVVVFRGVL